MNSDKLIIYLGFRDRVESLRNVEDLTVHSFDFLATPRFVITTDHGQFDWISSCKVKIFTFGILPLFYNSYKASK